RHNGERWGLHMNYITTERLVPASEQDADQWIDLRGIWASVWRRRRIFVAVCLAAALGAFLIGMAQPRLYTATSLMLIGSNDQIVGQGQNAPMREVDSAAVDSAVEVLNWQRLAMQIVRQLHLRVSNNPGLLGSALESLGLAPRRATDPHVAAGTFIAEAL